MGITTPKFITKEQFVETINALEVQYRADKKNADMIGEIFGTEMSGCYDNSVLSKSIIELLRNYFPADENGFCEIEHYCYGLCFGKNGDQYESPEQLFDGLNKMYLPFKIYDAKTTCINDWALRETRKLQDSMFDSAEKAMDSVKERAFLNDEAGQWDKVDNMNNVRLIDMIAMNNSKMKVLNGSEANTKETLCHILNTQEHLIGLLKEAARIKKPHFGEVKDMTVDQLVRRYGSKNEPLRGTDNQDA